MWWSTLTEECPITLEPLSSLKYPPYALVDTIDGKRHETYFDGLALATYIISQGNFTNPLTRVPLTYDDCVCLDYHLNEHIFQRGNSQAQQQHLESLGLRGDKLSVKENFLLRQSIKVKTDNNETTESQLRRAEMLRNEAGVALRGLFVFGHRNQDVESVDGDTVLPPTQPSNIALPGGFNLNHNPNNNSDDLGMSSSNYQTEGLQIIDDDEIAVEEADISNWIEVQEAFPYLNINAKEFIPQQPPTNNSDVDHGEDVEDVSGLLHTARHVSKLTIQEEEEKAKRLERAQQKYFLDALERKRIRIEARRRAKEDALLQMQDEKKAEDTLISARAEIDEWRSQQWAKWDRIAFIKSSKAKEDIIDSKLPPETIINENDQVDIIKTATQNAPLTAEEKEIKAAIKKKLKRQKAKERAKEKKRLERIEAEKKERAIELQKKKEESKKRCGACGGGILGSGFEKVRLCCLICCNLFLLTNSPISYHICIIKPSNGSLE